MARAPRQCLHRNTAQGNASSTLNVRHQAQGTKPGLPCEGNILSKIYRQYLFTYIHLVRRMFVMTSSGLRLITQLLPIKCRITSFGLDSELRHTGAHESKQLLLRKPRLGTTATNDFASTCMPLCRRNNAAQLNAGRQQFFAPNSIAPGSAIVTCIALVQPNLLNLNLLEQ